MGVSKNEHTEKETRLYKPPICHCLEINPGLNPIISRSLLGLTSLAVAIRRVTDPREILIVGGVGLRLLEACVGQEPGSEIVGDGSDIDMFYLGCGEERKRFIARSLARRTEELICLQRLSLPEERDRNILP